ncbi:MAG: hypothetical protein Q4F15_00960 [Bacillota bacterium]|nr:hypothetical protein [Bacillota bacterium]
MKKNDFAVFLVYVGMLAVAALVGFLVIRPIVEEAGGGANTIIFTVLFVFIGIFLNSLILELGHLLGAKAGHYNVVGWSLLGLRLKKNEAGKWKFSFGNFEGLTGETKIVPTDIKTSSVTGLVFFPIFFFLIEVLVCVILIAFVDGSGMASSTISLLKIFLYCCLGTGGMIFLYDYFPAHLDSITDGYRMITFNKAVNREAYNRMLLNQRNMELGKPVVDRHVYEEITDLTADSNYSQVYVRLDNNDIGSALKILQMTIDWEGRLSDKIKSQAEVMKLSLVLLTNKKDVGAAYYDNIENDVRSYISELQDGPSLRSYLLVTGVIEGTETETNYALKKAPRILEKTDDSQKGSEEKLLKLTIQRIQTLHPSWKLVMGTDLKLIEEESDKSKKAK